MCIIEAKKGHMNIGRKAIVQDILILWLESTRLD